MTSDATFLDTRWEDGLDWRDAAVNAALGASDAEWVWFTEQDFEVLDPFFWNIVESHERCRDAVGTRQGQERWHPCCLFVRRDVVDRTSRNFSVTAHGDHFAYFGKELEELGADVESLDHWPGPWYTHMAGLSHNHSLVDRDEPVTYRPDEFATYLYRCLARHDDLDAAWMRRTIAWLAWYAEHGEGRPA